MNYYNDNDPKACAWLRELIAQGHLPPGDVDERSILDVKPADLAGYDQCHFFAGVGGWALALRWAGLEHAAGIWTGSCPCQPFSCAGKRGGRKDERHLWPVFRDLIRGCAPGVVFGEQVDAAIKMGWWDHVAEDFEAMGYDPKAMVLPASIVGAPHRRHRMFFVASRLTLCDGRFEFVHHINGNKRDNRIENLELVTPALHAARHGQWKHPKVKTCEVCGKRYEPSPTKRASSKTCSKECRYTLMSQINRRPEAPRSMYRPDAYHSEIACRRSRRSL